MGRDCHPYGKVSYTLLQITFREQDAGIVGETGNGQPWIDKPIHDFIRK